MRAVYYPSWKVYKGVTPAQIAGTGATLVLYAFAVPGDDGQLHSHDEYADTQIPVDGETGCLRALRRLKDENPAVQVVLSLGGGTGSAAFAALAATEDGRATLATSARAWVDEYGLDGVDVDWEHPHTPDEGRDYGRLLVALRAQLPGPRYLLTSALPVDASVLSVVCGLEQLDYVNLMCYDFAGPWTSAAGHHAQLFASQAEQDSLGWGAVKEKQGRFSLTRLKSKLASAMHALDADADTDADACRPPLQMSGLAGIRQLLARDVPAHKILLGVPLYARVFHGACGAGDAFASGGRDEAELAVDYCDVPAAWRARATVDAARVAAWYTVEDADGGTAFVSLDVPQTLMWKQAFAARFGLAGVVFWAFGGDRAGDETVTHEMVGCCTEPETVPWER